MGGSGSGRKGKEKRRREPSAQAIAKLAEEMVQAGELVPDASHFKNWFKLSAEKELWFFSRWVLGNDHLGIGTFHRREVCPFLTDFESSRFKLLMLPMGHLKTTVVSRSMPLHILIQPRQRNIYFPGKLGRDCCVLLANENEQKSKENLSVLRGHLEENEWLSWCWPEIVWNSPKTEARLWTDLQLVVPREAIRAEASITAVGIKTGFIGRYFDAIFPDDIAALEASQNPPLMERAAKWRRAAKTRLLDKINGLYVGVGTHWGSNDIYVEWKKDTKFEVLIRSIIEYDQKGNEHSLWAEKFPLELVHKMQSDFDPIEWALWYMNKPVPAGYTALDWNEVRQYQATMIEGREFLVFEDSKLDERISQRYQRITKNLGFVLGGASPYDPMNGKVRTKPARGMDAAYFEAMHDKYPQPQKTLIHILKSDADGPGE